MHVLGVFQLASRVVSVYGKSIIIDGSVDELLAEAFLSAVLLIRSRVWLCRPLLMKQELPIS